jgi:hypothetical protein
MSDLSLFDRLRRAGKERGWDGQAEGFGGVHVDEQLKSRRTMDGDSLGCVPARTLAM